ncbi:MAG: ferredoxin [Acidimicrobiia bacterium]|nr:ferredoxin [Acidimicrobiia bacterium]
MTRLRVEVLRDRCAGYANCVDTAPDVFDLDEHDIAVVGAEDYPQDQRGVLERAVRRCPPKAIVVTDS